MAPVSVTHQIDGLYRRESRRVLATLIRLLGDFELAEEALQEAFSAALAQWPDEGIPARPRAWLVSVGRFRAIDSLRRSRRHRNILARLEAEGTDWQQNLSPQDIEDDQLRLIFTCCHPALPQDAQVAMTLREVCGLTTEQVAKAFLSKPTTVAQRIVRAKRKIRAAAIPYEIPERRELPQRLGAVRQVLYLVFNEGYCASSGESLLSSSLMNDAIRLTRLLPQEPETRGLLALMLFQGSRASARTDAQGNLLRLEQQDRSLWQRSLIHEADQLLRQTLAMGPVGPYTVQAAIAGLHADAPSYAETDWQEILAFYDLLLALQPTPVVALNRAVALAMVHGPQAGLDILEQILARDDLPDYHLLYAARADFHRQLGNRAAAETDYIRALELTSQAAERDFLTACLQNLKMV